MTHDIAYLTTKLATLAEEAEREIGESIAKVQSEFIKAGQPGSEGCKMYCKLALQDNFKTHLHKVANLFIELNVHKDADAKTLFINSATQLAQRLVSTHVITLFGSPAFDPKAEYKTLTESPGVITDLCKLAGSVANDMERNVVNASVVMADSQRRKTELIRDLEPLKIHPDVLKYCSDELLAKDYFHAVSEAIKGLAEKIRTLTGLIEDGSELADKAFGGNAPPIAINSMSTKSEQSEQAGFIHLVKGAFGMFRNPTAHTPKSSWEVGKQNAEGVLTILSLIHKRIDAATDAKRETR